MHLIFIIRMQGPPSPDQGFTPPWGRPLGIYRGVVGEGCQSLCVVLMDTACRSAINTLANACQGKPLCFSVLSIEGRRGRMLAYFVDALCSCEMPAGCTGLSLCLSLGLPLLSAVDAQ